jgi:SAM-dependent methyltransferase
MTADSGNDRQTALIARFSDKYRDGQTALCREIERSVFGCVYGATSWTTKDEAETVAAKLELGPDTRLLDVGAGTGWPSIYWAVETGCHATCLDLPFEGLQVLRRRAEQDGVPERVAAVGGDGVALPFGASSFDAVFHSDVFC